MADKSRFTTDEWKKLIEAPMLAGIAVTAADPSGLWGTLKESLAAGGALTKVKADAAADPLIKAIAAEYETGEGRGIARDGLKARLAGGKPADITGKAVAALGDVASILDAKAPENAAAVRSWLGSISRAVADASKEGGFLGFGGVQVSDAEKATLAQVASALKVTA
jgi:hypothetical protein